MNFEKRPKVKQVLPTHCHFCDKAPELVEREYKELRPFKGEEFTIPCKDLYCRNCGASLVPDEAIQQQLEALVLAYQKRHDLLTAEEIRERRMALGFSQFQFCKRAKGVASATLKRIETGGNVQDPSTDQALRIALTELEGEKQLQENWDMLHKTFKSVQATPIDYIDFHGVVTWELGDETSTLKNMEQYRGYTSVQFVPARASVIQRGYVRTLRDEEESETEELNLKEVLTA